MIGILIIQTLYNENSSNQSLRDAMGSNKKKTLLSTCIQIILVKSPLLSLFFVTNAEAYLPVFPLNPDKPSAVHSGAGRFGEGRAKVDKYPRGFGTYGHQGVDINGAQGQKLYAVADSTVVGSVDTGRGGGIGTALKPINGPDIVVVYWHQSAITRAASYKNRVAAGTHIGYVGGTASSRIGASNAYPPHLHLGVGVRNQSEAVNLWLNNAPKNGGQFYKTGLGGTGASRTKTFDGKSYYWANPAPYLSKDVLMKTSLGNGDPLIKYLGNSIRSQYNALTGANLTLGPGAKKGEYADKIPKLKIENNGVPSSFSTEASRAAVVGVLEGGDADQILGQDTITPEELAYYAPPRTIFTGESSEVKIDIGDGDITQQELIAKIGNSRFGNQEWQSQLVSLSMRGMLVEYLNTINAANFVKKEMILQKERIESLYAAWTSQVTKSNLSGSLQSTLDRAATPHIIPEVSILPVEELFDMIESGNFSDLDLSSAISMGGDQYKQCDPAYVANFRAMPQAKQKELLALALRLGFNPNDFATAVAVETGFMRDQNKLYPKMYQARNKQGKLVNYYPAGGYIQLTKGGAGDIPYNRLTELYPAAKPIITKHLGSNFKSGAMSRVHGPYLRELGSINPRFEFAVYDAYFYAKNRGFHSIPASQKTLGLLYKMIFGSGYYAYSKNPILRAGYYDNKPYDIDGDMRISADEAVRNKRFRIRNCPYWLDADILSNKMGLTNEDLKLIPWSSAIGRLKSPTIENPGGNFALIQSLKAKQASNN